MEEKERYEYFFGTNTIKDNKTNQFYGCVVDLLNQQDKRIKELEEELENYKLCRCVDCSSEYEYGLETSIDELDKENQQLKQQLAISEKALELACERVKYFEEMQDKEMGFYEFFGYDSDYDLKAIIEQYKQQAKEILDNE